MSARPILHCYSKAVREIVEIRKRRLLVAVLAAIVGTSFASIGALPEISGPDAPPHEIAGRGGEGTYTIVNERGILAVRWEEPDYAFVDGGSSGGQDVTGYAANRSISETYGWIQVDAENEGGWGWVAHGFETYSNSIGGYSTAVYRYYIEYDDTNIGAKAWAQLHPERFDGAVSLAADDADREMASEGDLGPPRIDIREAWAQLHPERFDGAVSLAVEC